MVNQGKARAGSGGPEDGITDLACGPRWEGDGCHYDASPGPGGGSVEGVAAGVVLVVGHEEFVPGLEGERPKNRVHSGRSVGDEGQVPARGP